MLFVSGETKTGLALSLFPLALLATAFVERATLFFVFALLLMLIGFAFPVHETAILLADVFLVFSYVFQIAKGDSYVLRHQSSTLSKMTLFCVTALLVGTVINVYRTPQYMPVIFTNTALLLIRGYAAVFVAAEIKRGVSPWFYILSFLVLTIIYVLAQFSNYFTQSLLVSFLSINPNLVSSLADIFFPFFLFAPFISGFSKAVKALFFAGMILMASFYLLGQVRGSLIAVFFVATPFIFLKLSRSQLLSTISVAGVMSVIFFRDVLDSLHNFFMGEVSLYIRLLLWQTAAFIIEDKPLWGIGLDLYRLQKYQYMFPGWLDPIFVKSSHNLYLELVVSFGIVGTALILAITGAVLVELVRLYKSAKCKNKRFLYASITSAIVLTLVHGLIDCFLFFRIWMLLVFVLFGVVIGESEMVNSGTGVRHLQDTCFPGGK